MNRHIIAFIGCLIILLIGLGFFIGLNNQTYAVSTMSGDLHQTDINCSDCHTLDSDKAARGSMGIRQNATEAILYPDTDGLGWQAGDPFPCEFCHRDEGGFPDSLNNHYDKKAGFSATLMSYTQQPNTQFKQDLSKGPSGHPIISYGYPLGGASGDGFDNDGDGIVDEEQELYNPQIYCTNCHDRDTAVYPTHEFSPTDPSNYAVQARLLVRDSGALLDPDPWDSTVVKLGSFNSWNSSHDSTTSIPVIDYEANPGETGVPFYGSDFCLTCHDSDGFPANPYAASESATYRIPAKPPFATQRPGTVPDIKSLWDDMGHYVKYDSTGTYLNKGDKIPCSTCHVSHYSADKVSLLNDFVLEAGGDASDHTPIEVCLRCHDQNRQAGSSNPVTLQITNDPNHILHGIDELLPPGDHDGRPIEEHFFSSGYGGRKSCLAPYEVQNEEYNDGCHQSPHAPRADCGGCHRDEAQGATGGYEAKVAAKEAAKNGIKMERGVSADYYSSHPVYIRLSENDPDIAAINEFYNYMGAQLPLGPDGTVYCTTCHNFHGDSLTDAALGISPDGVYDDQAILRMPYQELCTQCHERIIVRDGQGGTRRLTNDHGGFIGDGGSEAGVCNKCHSMHGRHPFTTVQGGETFAYELHYGMYGSYNATNQVLYDSSYYQDIEGVQYTKSFNSKLLHDDEQHVTCGRCHGVVDPPASFLPVVPPNVYFPTASNNFREDVYFKDEHWDSDPARSNSTHKVDLGTNTPWGQPSNIQLRCGSCHDPHGSDNFAQLRSTVKRGIAGVGDTIVYITGIRVNAYYDSSYSKTLYYRTVDGSDITTDGMTQFCVSCHTKIGDFYYDTTIYDTTFYMRHPMNTKVSMLHVNIYNFDKLVLQNKSTNPNDGEIFCMTCHWAHGSNENKLRKFQRTESCQLYCHVEIVEK